jgi:hypothetical protein
MFPLPRDGIVIPAELPGNLDSLFFQLWFATPHSKAYYSLIAKRRANAGQPDSFSEAGRQTPARESRDSPAAFPESWRAIGPCLRILSAPPGARSGPNPAPQRPLFSRSGDREGRGNAFAETMQTRGFFREFEFFGKCLI